MNIFSKLFLLIFFTTAACNDVKQKELKRDTSLKSEIQKVKLASLNGEPINMEQHKGQTVFINFWATWCKPCREEMPSIQRAKALLKNENIEFLFASDESIDQIESFKASHDYGLNYVNAGNMEELNIMGLPTTFIFDKNGKQVFSEMGYRKWDDRTNIDFILKIVRQE